MYTYVPVDFTRCLPGAVMALLAEPPADDDVAGANGELTPNVGVLVVNGDDTGTLNPVKAGVLDG